MFFHFTRRVWLFVWYFVWFLCFLFYLVSGVFWVGFGCFVLLVLFFCCLDRDSDRGLCFFVIVVVILMVTSPLVVYIAVTIR